MPRRPRSGSGGLVFHVMNRGTRRLPMFDTASDYASLAGVLREAAVKVRMRVLCFALMPNHWHLVLWPESDSDLSTFMAWATGTHVRRWHLARGSVGTGTLYQGRYKAIAVNDDEHFLAVCRYVERNPVRAQLVERAEAWPWSSASAAGREVGPELHPWPVARPADWQARINEPEPESTLEDIRLAIHLSRPWGPQQWIRDTTTRLGWTTGRRRRGRPPRTERGGNN